MEGCFIPSETSEFSENIEVFPQENATIKIQSNLNCLHETNSSNETKYRYGEHNEALEVDNEKVRQPQGAERVFSNSTKYGQLKIIDENLLENYSEEKCLYVGHGTYGHVYKCFYHDLKKIVAVKKEYCNEETNEKVLYEVKKLHALGNHAGVIPLYGIVLKDNLIDGVVMKLCDCSLRKFLDDLRIDLSTKFGKPKYESHLREAISYRKCVEVFLEIVSAMAYAHSTKANDRDIIHADINTKNVCVVLTKTKMSIEKVFLIDFSDERDPTCVGTPIYMDPILVLNKSRIPDKSSDVYSTGIVLWEMLTLKTPPFKFIKDILKFHQNKQTLPIDEEWPDEIKNILRECLNPEPTKRPTFLQLINDAKDFLAKFPYS